MALMPTEIGVTNGTLEVPLVMDVQTPTMDLRPFLKLKIGKNVLIREIMDSQNVRLNT